MTSRVGSELAVKLAGSTVTKLTLSVEAFNANRFTHCWVSDRPCIMLQLARARRSASFPSTLSSHPPVLEALHRRSIARE